MTKLTSAMLSILLALATGSAYAYDATSGGTTARDLSSTQTLAKWEAKQDSGDRGSSTGAYSPAQSG
jgi:hypothetical protein